MDERQWARARLVVSIVAVGALLSACGSERVTSGGSTTHDGPSAPATGGPITVQQLVERSAATPVAVRGLLYRAGGVTRLCEAVLESYPVQCGEPSVELVGMKVDAVPGLARSGGVTWKEGVVVTVERVVDGRFTVVDLTDAAPDASTRTQPTTPATVANP